MAQVISHHEEADRVGHGEEQENVLIIVALQTFDGFYTYRVIDGSGAIREF